MIEPITERIYGMYSMEHQGIQVRHSKRVGQGRDEWSEFIAKDGDEDYQHVFEWLKGQPHTYSLGVINIEATEQNVAEFNRLYALRKKCPGCNREYLTTTAHDSMRRQYHVLCARCGYILKSISDREAHAQRGPNSPPETARGRNHTHAKEFAHRRLVGRTVNVYKLGGVEPNDDPDIEMFLPLPEYGIVLVTFKPKEYSHGEAMAKMMPLSVPEFTRASGLAQCKCGKILYDHPQRHFDGLTLTVDCNERFYKL